MNILSSRFPGFGRRKKILGIIGRLDRIVLEKPRINGFRKFLVKSDRKVFDSSFDELIFRYSLCRDNLFRAWYGTKDDFLLDALLFVRVLEPFNVRVDEYVH